MQRKKFRHHFDLKFEICVPQLYDAVLCFGQFRDSLISIYKLRFSTRLKLLMNTSANRKVSNHFVYLENLSRDLDVTWHSVGGDLTVHL